MPHGFHFSHTFFSHAFNLLYAGFFYCNSRQLGSRPLPRVHAMLRCPSFGPELLAFGFGFPAWTACPLCVRGSHCTPHLSSLPLPTRLTAFPPPCLLCYSHLPNLTLLFDLSGSASSTLLLFRVACSSFSASLLAPGQSLSGAVIPRPNSFTCYIFSGSPVSLRPATLSHSSQLSPQRLPPHASFLGPSRGTRHALPVPLLALLLLLFAPPRGTLLLVRFTASSVYGAFPSLRFSPLLRHCCTSFSAPRSCFPPPRHPCFFCHFSRSTGLPAFCARFFPTTRTLLPPFSITFSLDAYHFPSFPSPTLQHAPRSTFRRGRGFTSYLSTLSAVAFARTLHTGHDFNLACTRFCIPHGYNFAHFFCWVISYSLPSRWLLYGFLAGWVRGRPSHIGGTTHLFSWRPL